MSLNQILNLSWTAFKDIKDTSGLTIYRSTLANNAGYITWLVSRSSVMQSRLLSASDISDFTTNYLSGSVLAESVDHAIALNDVAGNLSVEVVLDDDAVNIVQILDSDGDNIVATDGNVHTGLYNAAGNAAIGTDGSAFPSPAAAVIVGGTDGTNTQAMAVDAQGRVKTNTFDGSGNAITSTSSALDINVKSQTTALKVSKNTTDNAVTNPIFTQLSDGSTAFGTTGNPIFVNNKDGAGNSLTSTAGRLDVGLTGANTVKLTDAAGTNITLNTGGSLKNTIYDANGNIAVGTDGVAFPGTAGTVIIGGTDGTNTQAISVDSAGRQRVDLFDNAGNAINSTSNALNVSLRDSAGTAVTLNAGGSLKNTLYAPTGSSISLLESATVTSSQQGLMVAGWDGTTAHFLRTDNLGRIETAPSPVAASDNVYVYAEDTTTSTAANNVILTYTVPAGKSFYLAGYSMTRITLVTTANPSPYRLVANSVQLKRFSVDWNGGNGYGNVMIWSENFPYPFFVAAAGQVIQVTVTPSTNASTVWGASILGIIK